MVWRGIWDGIKSIPRHLWNWLVQPEGWQVRHFAASPFGAALMTWFWTNQARFWEHWDTVAEMASLGAISYGVIAVLAEGGIRVFYALSQIGKDRERRRRELEEMKAAGRAAGEAAGRAAGEAAGRAAGRAAGEAAGIAAGVAAERQRWQQWNEARLRAAAEGREFNEPPPGN